MLYILWVWKNAYENVSIIMVSCRVCYLKDPMCLTYSSLPHPSAPAITLSFYCLHSFAFLRCRIVGIIQYIAFSDWFLSLSNILLSFLHVFSWRLEIIFHCLMYHSSSIHWLKDILVSVSFFFWTPCWVKLTNGYLLCLKRQLNSVFRSKSGA